MSDRRKCLGCNRLHSVPNSDYCLPCLNSSPGCTGKNLDEQIRASMATNAPGGPRLCIECGAPVKPINLFGGRRNFYRCTNKNCLHEDTKTRDNTMWPEMTPAALQDQYPTTRRD